MNSRRLLVPAATLAVCAMLAGTVGATPIGYQVLVTNPAPGLASSGSLWAAASSFNFIVDVSETVQEEEDSCLEGPAFAVLTDPEVPGVDSKAIPTSDLGLGSAPSARRVKLRVTDYQGAETPRFWVSFRGRDCSSPSTGDPTASGPSPLTFTVPTWARWVIVTPTLGDGGLGGIPSNPPGAVLISFTAEKV